MPLVRGTWLSLFAMLMIFIGPLISQAMPMDHHDSMSMTMQMDMESSAHGHHADPQPPTADHHALWEKCGYCTLLFSCPALPHSVDLSLLDAPRPKGYRAVHARQGHARQPVFPGARSRAPPRLP